MTDQAPSSLRGSCLCGAVSLRVGHGGRPSMSACHCGICRRWTGGPFMSIECHQAPEIDGAEHVRTFASSEWAERGFCSRCGTHLFYRFKEGEFYAYSAGLFDEAGRWPFELQVFIDEKPGNYAFADRTREMTGEDVFKAWSP